MKVFSFKLEIIFENDTNWKYINCNYFLLYGIVEINQRSSKVLQQADL